MFCNKICSKKKMTISVRIKFKVCFRTFVQQPGKILELPRFESRSATRGLTSTKWQHGHGHTGVFLVSHDFGHENYTISYLGKHAHESRLTTSIEEIRGTVYGRRFNGTRISQPSYKYFVPTAYPQPTHSLPTFLGRGF
jgi:hypothetical protein